MAGGRKIILRGSDVLPATHQTNYFVADRLIEPRCHKLTSLPRPITQNLQVQASLTLFGAPTEAWGHVPWQTLKRWRLNPNRLLCGWGEGHGQPPGFATISETRVAGEYHDWMSTL